MPHKGRKVAAVSISLICMLIQSMIMLTPPTSPLLTPPVTPNIPASSSEKENFGDITTMKLNLTITTMKLDHTTITIMP
jgi:hypothetical protein